MPTIIRFGSLGPTGTPGGGRPPRNKAQTIALAVAALAAGALLLAFGLVLLAGVAVAGTVVGGSVLLYHRVTGRWPKFMRVATYTGSIGDPGARASGLDPTREIQPPSPPEVRRLPGSDEPE